MKKVAITNISGNATMSDRSHQGAWLHMLAHQLHDSGVERDIVTLPNKKYLEEYDVVYLNHGQNFGGSLNLFGGTNDANISHFERIVKAADAGVKFVSTDIPCPMYGDLIAQRAVKSKNLRWKEFDCERLNEVCRSMDYVRQPPSRKIVIGDSHAISVYMPGFRVYRNDGKTMHGFASAPEDIMQEVERDGEFDEVVLYFGNIDIRHHLCRGVERRSDTDYRAISNTADLISRYAETVARLFDGKDITLVQPLPIENESRKIPKSGFYKGKPFWGSWSERNQVREYMDEMLSNICISEMWGYFTWPVGFTNSKGELTFDVMEKPQSVHIAPKFYKTDLFSRDNQNSFGDLLS